MDIILNSVLFQIFNRTYDCKSSFIILYQLVNYSELVLLEETDLYRRCFHGNHE